jgi:hypothetical protein
MMNKPTSLLALVGLGIFIAGCGGNGSDGTGIIGNQNPRVRAVVAYPDTDDIDAFVEGELILNDAGFGTASTYQIFDNGNRNVAFRDATSQGVIDEITTLFEENKYYTVVATGSSGNRTIIPLTNGQLEAPGNDAKLRVIHAAEGTSPVDVYITDPSVNSLSGVTPTFNDIVFEDGAVEYVVFPADTYRIRVTGSNDQTTVIDTTITVEPNAIQTALLVESPTDLGLLVLNDKE